MIMRNLGPDTIKYTLLDDNNAMLAAFNSGELNFIMNFPTDEMANYLASGRDHGSSVHRNLLCMLQHRG